MAPSKRHPKEVLQKGTRCPGRPLMEIENTVEMVKGVLVGLAVRRKGVRVLGVDLVIKDEVVGSVSGGPMGEEGPGKGSTTGPTDLGAETRDPEGTLNTDSGSWVASRGLVCKEVDNSGGKRR
jgi:hypothetical protein